MDTTLLKGLALLEVLAASAEPCGITELAERLGWMKSNIHRVLQTLAHGGYVKKDALSGRYTCTLKLWELGTLLMERLDICAVARPHMSTLAHRTDETVHLSILDGCEVLYIDKIESQQPVRAYTRVGGRAPAYCVATGKALLSCASTSVIDEVLGRLVLHTSRTITSRDALRKELQRARESGYALNRGEWRESVHGVAAAVCNAQGHALAAVGISGPGERLNLRRMQEFSKVVVATSQGIARDLGFTSAPSQAGLAAREVAAKYAR